MAKTLLSAQACRAVIELALGSFKDEWAMNGADDFRYIITEKEITTEGQRVDRNASYEVRISCCFFTKAQKETVIYREAYCHEQLGIAKKSAWNRMLRQICYVGVVHGYQNIIKLHRNDAFPEGEASPWVKQYPLTPGEVK